VGILIGAALMQVLRNMITLVTTRNNVEFAIIGAVILLGVVADELARRIAARRRAAQVLETAGVR
jgi:ribose transport system permease protein